MFSSTLFCVSAVFAAMITLSPLINYTSVPLARLSRTIFIHRICTIRNQLLPFVNPRTKGMDADGKALEEIMSLYHPPLFLSNNTNENEIYRFRQRARKMFINLYPIQSSTCIIEPHTFEYNGNQIDMYLIHHDELDDWGKSDTPIILYFHGGGFVFGDIEIYSGYECDLSQQLNIPIFHVEFPPSPEYSLRHILDDVISVYRVLRRIDPNIHRRLIGMGDSSGGMLWIYLLQWLVSNNITVPQGVVLHSPWPDLDFRYINHFLDSYVYLNFHLVLKFRQLAIGTEKIWEDLSDKQKSRYSPKVDSYEGFPPLYITAGSHEIFIEEIRQMINNAAEDGVDLTYTEGKGMMHSYALLYLWSSKAQCVQEKMRYWINKQLYPSDSDIDEKLDHNC